MRDGQVGIGSGWSARANKELFQRGLNQDPSVTRIYNNAY